MGLFTTPTFFVFLKVGDPLFTEGSSLTYSDDEKGTFGA